MSNKPPEQLDLIWGLDKIAAFIGRSRSQTFNALVKGEIPGKRVNKRWVASRRKLEQFFEEVAS